MVLVLGLSKLRLCLRFLGFACCVICLMPFGLTVWDLFFQSYKSLFKFLRPLFESLFRGTRLP